MEVSRDFIHIQSKRFPLYGGHLVIVLSNSTKKVKDFTELERPYIFAHAVEMNYKGHMGYAAIFNPDNKYKRMDNGSIAHESFHIAGMLLNDRGVKLDYDNDEPMAYLIGWITNQIYTFFKKHNFEIK